MPLISFESVAQVGLDPASLDWERLDAFHAALYEANATRNLTRVSPDDAGVRHYLDSLLHQDLIPSGSRVLDIGTGPGFPAWPLAWARPDLQVVALDSNGKMLGFLRTQVLSNLEVVQARAEEFTEREGFDVVTGRAVAPLMIQLELSAPFATIGGRVVPMRSANDELGQDEVKQLGLKRSEVIRRSLPGTDAERCFPIYEKVGKSQAKFPRRWSEIKAKPLAL